MSTFVIPAGWVPVGRAFYDDALASATELGDTPDGGDVLPAAADTALIYVSSQDLHVTFEFKGDAEAADVSDPKWPASSWIVIEGGRTALAGFSCIESAASSRIDIWYFNVNGS